jgi:tRNA modification GTPase
LIKRGFFVIVLVLLSTEGLRFLMMQDDVIAAIATPIGEGGIAVIRISGSGAIDIADKSFRGKRSLSTARSHTAHVGMFVDCSGNDIDEVVATVFRAPRSYTTENVVEISCHGGMFIARKILTTTIECGARMAEPGEFTRRAFLNGRLDLSQAEAVADLIRSKSDLSMRASLSQLRGDFSHKITQTHRQVLDLCSMMELELDFTEEGIKITDQARLVQTVSGLIEDTKLLADTFARGRVYREGIRVVLAGRPNVGKSSLLNALIGEERAIVTHVSGTTRDVIDEAIQIDGVLFRIIDTAGFRKSVDLVESEGIRRAEMEIGNADILVAVIDSSEGFTDEAVNMLHYFEQLSLTGNKRTVLALNKIDLLSKEEVPTIPDGFADFVTVRVSAKTSQGIPMLKKSLVESFSIDAIDSSESSPLVISARHHDCMRRAQSSLEIVLLGLKENLSNELIAVDLRSALNFLGEITGATTTEDILNNIFSQFCIGK